MLPAKLPLDELAQRCAEHTQQFRRRQPSDPQYCFELLRRALAEGVDDALTWVYRIYERQVLTWVHQYPRFAQTRETADDFANKAFAQFYFALRGPKFEKFASLAQVLAYLKACVHTAVAQELRKHQGVELQPIDDDVANTQAPDPLGHALEAEQLWAHICRLLPDERDQALARAALVLGLKPAQILRADPKGWRSAREVSVELYRIRRLLRRDPELQQWLGLQGAPDDP